jgi:uncharacterized protein YbjT (DUF2867 family)
MATIDVGEPMTEDRAGEEMVLVLPDCSVYGASAGIIMEKTVAIIGNSGTNARPWTDAFLLAGWQVRCLVREPHRVAPRPRLTPAMLELAAVRSYGPALNGVDVLALITPAQPEQVEWETGLIDAARRAGVAAIIKLSVMGAEIPAPISPFARWAAGVEGVLRASRMPHILLRANGFMQNLLRQRGGIAAGNYVEPLGTAAVSYVDVRDLAAVAVAVADGPFDGRALALTGAAALTGEQMAGALATALGRPVRFVSPALPLFRAALAERGVPAWQIDALVELYEAVHAGRAPHLSTLSADIAAVTGGRPRSFDEFARSAFGQQAGT